MLDNMLNKAMQACINAYGGEYGEVKKIFDEELKFNTSHVQGFFGINKDEIYIVFEGSDGTIDWMDNFNFKQVKPVIEHGGKAKVHSGFLFQYLLANKKIIDFFENNSYLNDNVKRVVVTGHSLGGAIATICALDVSLNMRNIFKNKGIALHCITFGSPRVGNMRFKKFFESNVRNSVRVVNGADAVCKVPFNFLKYVHVRKRVRIGRKSIFNNVFPSAKDHYPQEYLKNIGDSKL